MDDNKEKVRGKPMSKCIKCEKAKAMCSAKLCLPCLDVEFHKAEASRFHPLNKNKYISKSQLIEKIEGMKPKQTIPGRWLGGYTTAKNQVIELIKEE